MMLAQEEGALDAIVKRCIHALSLQKLPVQVVAFDMDQTAVAVHSRGQLRRDQLHNYLDKAVTPFLRVVPALHAAGYCLAMATHSDEAEFDATKGITPETHILGHELAMALLQRYFSSDVVAAFFIVAYNPRVRGDTDENRVKRYHMRQLQAHFGIDDASRILFFDDTPGVVEDCRDHCGTQAVLVNAETGLQWSDFLQLGDIQRSE
jgi:hypothetical protein